MGLQIRMYAGDAFYIGDVKVVFKEFQGLLSANVLIHYPNEIQHVTFGRKPKEIMPGVFLRVWPKGSQINKRITILVDAPQTVTVLRESLKNQGIPLSSQGHKNEDLS